jgi:parvulin-like peptidyl-prolyl isomerase
MKMKSNKLLVIVVAFTMFGTYLWSQNYKEDDNKTQNIKPVEVKKNDTNKTLTTTQKMKKEGVILSINGVKYKKDDFPKEYEKLKYQAKKRFLSKYLYYKVALNSLFLEQKKYRKEIDEALVKEKVKMKKIGVVVNKLEELVLALKISFNTISYLETLKNDQNITNKIKTFYKEHKDEYSYPNSVEISHISVKTEKQAKKIIYQLKEKNATIELFSSLAKKYSLDIKSRDIGGYIGKVSEKEIDKIFFDKLWKAKENSIVSIPLKMNEYYHVIYFFKKYNHEKKTLTQERLNIIDFLLKKDMRKWRKKNYESSSKNTVVEVYDIKI